MDNAIQRPASVASSALSSTPTTPIRSDRRWKWSLDNTAVALGLLYAALIPYETIFLFVFGADSILKPYRLVGITLAGLWLGIHIALKPLKLRFDIFDVGFITLFSWGILMALFWSVALQRSLRPTLTELILVGFSFSTFFLIKQLNLSSNKVILLMATYIGSGIVAIAIRLALDPHALVYRLEGFYHNPNSAAFDAALVLIAYVTGLLLYQGRFRRRLWMVGFPVSIFSVYAIIASGSRGTLLAVGISIALVLYIAWYHRRLSSTSSIALIAVMCASAVAFTVFQSAMSGAVTDRFTAEEVRKGSGRRDIWRGAFNASIDHYLLGVGMGQYVSLNQHYLSQLDHLYNPSVGERDLVTHSDLMDLFTSYGLPGLFIFLWMTSRLIQTLWGWVTDRTQPPLIPAIFFASYATLLVTQLTRNSFTGPQFFFLLSLIVSYVRAITRERFSEPDENSSVIKLHPPMHRSPPTRL